MFQKLTRLHLRWFGLFSFVAVLAIFFSHLQDGNLKILSQLSFYAGLAPVFSVCAILALFVPWGMFLVDPRRTTKGATIENFLAYWKVS